MSGRPWTGEEIELLKVCYEDTPTSELAELLGRPIRGVWLKAQQIGVGKSLECIAEMSRQKMLDPNHPARKHQIKPGNVPRNKGVKSPGVSHGRMSATQFKKGQRSINWMPIGATRKCDGYVLVKVSDIPKVPYFVNWLPLHILLWEEKHGPVKPGHVVRFKDGNKENIDITNLESISRADLARRNSIHNMPPELKQVIQLNGALKRRLRTLEERNAQKKQDVRSERSPVRDARVAEG